MQSQTYTHTVNGIDSSALVTLQIPSVSFSSLFCVQEADSPAFWGGICTSRKQRNGRGERGCHLYQQEIKEWEGRTWREFFQSSPFPALLSMRAASHQAQTTPLPLSLFSLGRGRGRASLYCQRLDISPFLVRSFIPAHSSGNCPFISFFICTLWDEMFLVEILSYTSGSFRFVFL